MRNYEHQYSLKQYQRMVLQIKTTLLLAVLILEDAYV
jgi:hypothetical protein